MKETIIHYLQIGSVWMFVCIAYFFVTMIIAAISRNGTLMRIRNLKTAV